MDAIELKYRPNVAGILRNSNGEILICERLGMPGAWQFPQGGVDPGETWEEALVRELREEVGVTRKLIRIIDRRGPYRYLFGDVNGTGETVVRHGFHGNEQTYFLVEFLGEPEDVDLETHHPEFQAHRWIPPSEFKIEWLPLMKREVYRTVFKEFFGLQI